MTAATFLLRALAPVAPPACFACRAGAAGDGALCADCRRGLAWLGDEPLALADGE